MYYLILILDICLISVDMPLPFTDRHNVCAFLDESIPKAQEYLESVRFLKRSRTYYAISHKPTLYMDLFEALWSSATSDS